MSKSSSAGNRDGRPQWLDKLGVVIKPRAVRANGPDDVGQRGPVTALDVTEDCRNSLLQGGHRYVPINFRVMLANAPAISAGVSPTTGAGGAKRGREVYADDEHGAAKFAWIQNKLKRLKARQTPGIQSSRRQGEGVPSPASPHQPFEPAVQIGHADRGVIQDVRSDHNLNKALSVVREIEAAAQLHIQKAPTQLFTPQPDAMVSPQPFRRNKALGHESVDQNTPSPGEEVLNVQHLSISDGRSTHFGASIQQRSLSAGEDTSLERDADGLGRSVFDLMDVAATASTEEHRPSDSRTPSGSYTALTSAQGLGSNTDYHLNAHHGLSQTPSSMVDLTDDLSSGTPFYSPGSPASLTAEPQWSYYGAGQYRNQGRANGVGRKGAQHQSTSGGVLGSVRVGKPPQTSNGRGQTQGAESGRRRKAPKPRRGPSFACPFSKHNPHRYASVYTPCTYPPGLEPKRVTEHVRRCHSLKFKGGCLYCKYKWTNDDQWWEEFEAHACPIRDDENQVYSNPEPMGREQERVLGDLQLRACHTPQERWKRLYEALFPGSQNVPEPTYDYYVLNLPVSPPRRPAVPEQHGFGNGFPSVPLVYGDGHGHGHGHNDPTNSFPPNWPYGLPGYPVDVNNQSFHDGRPTMVSYPLPMSGGMNVVAGMPMPANVPRTDDEDDDDDEDDVEDEIDDDDDDDDEEEEEE